MSRFRRQFPNRKENGVHHELKQRQIGKRGRSMRSAITASRKIYTSLTPNHTIHNVILPFGCLVNRFTPDGKYLICFLEGIQLYHIVSAVYHLDTSIQDTQSGGFHARAFNHFFSLKQHCPIVMPLDHALCSSFCLVTADHQHLLLVSSAKATGPESTRRYPCSLSTITASNDYVFYLLHIETGKVTGTYHLSNDYVHISSHYGVSIHESTFAIMSTLHQNVHILSLCDGQFEHLRSIGWLLRQDDALMIERAWPMKRCSSPKVSDRMDNITYPLLRNESHYGCFQQALLSNLYRAASAKDDGGSALRYFYRNFSAYANLKMARMQFLGDSKLLVKMTPPIQRQEAVDLTNQLNVFVIFDLRNHRIEKLFDDTSDEVTKMIENDSDRLRGVPHDGHVWYASTCSNNETLHTLFQKRLFTWGFADSARRSSAAKRLSVNLICAPQTVMECPYLDLNLFSFDESLVSSLERSRYSNQDPIRFYSRATKKLKFKIECPSANTPRSSNPVRRRCCIISHPVYPFIITKQLSPMGETIVNFHVHISHR